MIPESQKILLKEIPWQTFYDFLQKNNLLENPEAYRAYLYARGYRDFKFFLKAFFPEYCQLPFSKMHEAFFEDEAMPEKRGRREAIAAPRFHAKTTIKMLAKSVHAIVYGYEPFIVILGYSRDHAEAKVQEVLEALRNPRLVSVFGHLAPVPGQKQKSKAQGGKRMFITANQIKVLPRSRGQEVRGLNHGAHRPTLIICDDVENLAEAQNPEMRLKVRDWFFKSVLKMVEVNGSSNVIFIGTCLHQESLLSELLVNPGWQGRKYQAIERFSERHDLWEKWTELYTDLSNPHREADADGYYAANEASMLTGTQVLWPEGDSYLKLMKQLVSEGQAAFYSEKQNDPYDPERQLFKMEKAKRFELVYQGHAPYAIRWLDGSGKVIPWTQIQKVIAFHDPAFTEKPTQKSTLDFAAIVVVAKDRDGYMYVLDCFLERTTPSKQIEAALALHSRWHLDVLYYESNLGQSLLKPLYQTAQEKSPTTQLLRVMGVGQYSNKFERISSLEPSITYGHLLFANTLDSRLIQQLILFPTGHDDGPDAVQGAVAQLKKPQDDFSMITAPIQTGNERPNPFGYY